MKIFSFSIGDNKYSVEFVRDFGVVCKNLLPQTGSALVVAEAVWPHRNSSYTYYDNEYVEDVRKMVYQSDLYNALTIGFQSWNRK